MRSLIIDARLIGSSGIGTYQQNLIPFLLKYFNITLLGRKKEINAFEWSKEVNLIETNSLIYSIKEQIEIPFKIPNADLFWSPHFNIPLLPIKAKKRVVTIHDVYHLDFNKELTFSQRIYSKLLINSAVSRSEVILTDSEFSKLRILKHTPVKSDKIKVVYCGINKSYFVEKAKNNFISIKKKYKIPDNYILFIGNVKPHKNLKTLIQALKIVLDNSININLLIVGRREGFVNPDSNLNKLISSNKKLEEKVYFTGFVENEDLPAIYKNAKLLCLPSFYEGFGLPPLEAMACGCPTIVSNAASLPEVCGDASIYFDPNNETELADKIRLLLSDKDVYKTLQIKGEDRIDYFKWETPANQIITIFNNLTN